MRIEFFRSRKARITLAARMSGRPVASHNSSADRNVKPGSPNAVLTRT
jgi:hypothetical protein